MKKWMVVVLTGMFMAGAAMAEDAVPWYKKLFNKNADEQTQVIPPAPAAPAPAAPVPEAPNLKRQGAGESQRPKLTPEQMEKMKAMRGAGERQQMPLSPEQMAKMEKMKAAHEELMKLGEAARSEADPVKKEALIAEIRAKLTAAADKMQAEMKKRLDQAEKELPKLKERMAEAEKNKATRIEEQVQRILSGQPLEMPQGKRPELPGGGKNKKGPKPPVTK